ncbi:efflux ABC transporter, permease protein [Cutibacterium avidum]|uniref:ABC transporter permease n=1 Tax=Cutibacterium avidum TaxID=33010 RepID=UPI00076435F5|nr:ABC transporter permease [Cutibacterium avidum]KXA68237.1 efflux ABC transporter, permease protein [Cutibacterium avidum]MDU5022773.1 ABC transporter permease [Cutibacterium avidum]MDU5340317.1 ABC transporter permease [Cutibacterium avidum]
MGSGNTPDSPYGGAVVRLSGEAVARGRSHRRLITRLAARDIRRHKARSLLIVLLIALPVAIMSGLGTILDADGTTTDSETVSKYGDADMLIMPIEDWDGHCSQDSPDFAYCDIQGSPTPELRARQRQAMENLHVAGHELYPLRVRTVDVAWRSATLEGAVKGIDLTAVRPDRMELPSGPMPRGNNVWASGSAAKKYGWSTGSHVTIDGRQRTITGLTRERSSSYEPTFWVGPEDPLVRNGALTYYVKGPQLAKEQIAKLNASGLGVEERQLDSASDNAGVVAGQMFALVLAAVVLSSVVTATIASAAFSIGARQQRRMLALLGTTGAARRDLMGVMIGQGLLLGSTGAVLGVVLGIGAANVFVVIGRRANPGYLLTYSVNWEYAIVGLVIGLLAAVVACWLPAREVARQDVLMGVRHAEAAASPVRRPMAAIVVAIIGALVGIGWVVLDRVNTSDPYDVVPLNIGIVVTIVILYLAAVLALPWLVNKASIPPSSRLAIRFALRDLNRNRGRAVAGAAASMAITVLAGVFVTLADGSAIQDRNSYQPSYAANVARLTGDDGHDHFASEKRMSKEVEQVEAVFGPSVKYQRALEPVTCDKDGQNCRNGLSVDAPSSAPRDNEMARSLSVPSAVIDDGTLYELLTGQKADGKVMKALDKGIILFQPDARGRSQVSVFRDDEPNGSHELEVTAIKAPDSSLGLQMPALIGRNTAAKALGVSPDAMKTQTTDMWLRLPHPPTSEGGDRLQNSLMDITGSTSDFQWEEGFSDFSGTVVRWAAIIGALLATFVGAVVLALTLSDSSVSRTAIASVGASTATLRRMVAAQAFVTTGIGQVLGLIVGFVPVVIMIGCADTMQPVPWPVGWLALIVVAPPVLLAIVARWCVPVPKARMPRVD